MKNNIIKLLLIIGLWPSVALADVSLVNPLRAENVPQFVGIVIRAVLGLVGALALLYFVLGGLNWLTSQGNPEKVKRGKETITWATFGIAIIFASYALVNYVLGKLVR